MGKALHHPLPPSIAATGFPDGGFAAIELQQTCFRDVVIVDDDNEQLENLAELLSYSGWTAHSYTSPLDAIAYLETHGCTAIVSDIHMPAMLGTQLAQWVCDQHPETQVILMSGCHLDPADLREGWVFLRKPIDFPILLRTIEGA